MNAIMIYYTRWHHIFNNAIVDIRLCPRCAIALYNSVYFLNLSIINAKLTLIFYVHASKYICFSANFHRYHSNNGCSNVRFSNSSH